MVILRPRSPVAWTLVPVEHRAPEDLPRRLHARAASTVRRRRLHVSQSTVSARIRTLEEQTGQVLFQRLKNGAVLTGPRTAHGPLRGYRGPRVGARAAIPLARGNRSASSARWGSSPFSPSGSPTEWIGWVNERHPEIALRVEAGDSESLMRRLDDALIDIAVAFRPRTKPGFKIETLYTDKLILVSSDKRGLDKSWPDDYVFVDWGESFRAAYADAFPERSMPSIRTPLPGVAPQPHSASGRRRLSFPFARGSLDRGGASPRGARRSVLPHTDIRGLHPPSRLTRRCSPSPSKV